VEAREDAWRRWPLLANLLAAYFNQDYLYSYGSIHGALAAAVGNYSLADRRAVLKEFRNWKRTETGFGVALRFKTPNEAKRLMDRLYDDILASVISETSH
jgi:hypothetical protein